MPSHISCKDCGKRIDRSAGKERCHEHKLAYLAARRQARLATKARVRARAALEEGPMPMSINDAIRDVEADRRVEAVLSEAERTNSFRPVAQAVHDGLMNSIKDEPVVIRKLEPEPKAADLSASERYQRETKRRIAKLSPELKLEIGTFYERHEIPLNAIAAEFKLHNSHVGAIARELGLTPRVRGNSDSKSGQFERVNGSRVWIPDEPVAVKEDVMVAEPEPELPPATVKALESMLEPPAPILPPVLPARPEPTLGTTKWKGKAPRFEVTVHGTFFVSAPTILAAMQDLIKQYPDLRITAIREA